MLDNVDFRIYFLVKEFVLIVEVKIVEWNGKCYVINF